AAVDVVGLVGLRTRALRKILGVVRIEGGIPVLDGARADARRRTGARTCGPAHRDPDQRDNDHHDARYPRLPPHHRNPSSRAPARGTRRPLLPNGPDGSSPLQGIGAFVSIEIYSFHSLF